MSIISTYCNHQDSIGSLLFRNLVRWCCRVVSWFKIFIHFSLYFRLGTYVCQLFQSRVFTLYADDFCPVQFLYIGVFTIGLKLALLLNCNVGRQCLLQYSPVECFTLNDWEPAKLGATFFVAYCSFETNESLLETPRVTYQVSHLNFQCDASTSHQVFIP